MSKKKTSSAAAKTNAAKANSSAVLTTAVRNSAVPPKNAGVVSAVKKPAPAYEDVALCAYFIWKSTGGSSYENWLRAERELSV